MPFYISNSINKHDAFSCQPNKCKMVDGKCLVKDKSNDHGGLLGEVRYSASFEDVLTEIGNVYIRENTYSKR